MLIVLILLFIKQDVMGNLKLQEYSKTSRNSLNNRKGFHVLFVHILKHWNNLILIQTSVQEKKLNVNDAMKVTQFIYLNNTTLYARKDKEEGKEIVKKYFFLFLNFTDKLVMIKWSGNQGQWTFLTYLDRWVKKKAHKEEEDQEKETVRKKECQVSIIIESFLEKLMKYHFLFNF